jgi:hypothetical protein
MTINISGGEAVVAVTPLVITFTTEGEIRRFKRIMLNQANNTTYFGNRTTALAQDICDVLMITSDDVTPQG